MHPGICWVLVHDDHSTYACGGMDGLLAWAGVEDGVCRCVWLACFICMHACMQSSSERAVCIACASSLLEGPQALYIAKSSTVRVVRKSTVSLRLQ
jgi:hypothetical protein